MTGAGNKSDQNATAEQLLGRVIGGKVKLERRIGDGAMGFLFQAQHLALKKPVAVKILKPRDDLQQIHSDRFAREAQSAARFDHPNSLQILDFGVEEPDRLHYIIMEYLQGYDLFQMLQKYGRFEPKRLVGIIVQALGALASAHDQGVIHRDLKPSNIMVVQRPNDDGELEDYVKVCDFGLAKIMDMDNGISLDGAPQTKHGMIVGTPAYMSPEQAVGEALDGRSDLYSCGVVMYEMLTGQPPFSAPTHMALLLKHVSEPPPPLSPKQPNIDPKLESLIMWMLQKNRTERCQSARELRKAFKTWLSTPPPNKPPLSAVTDDLFLTPAPQSSLPQSEAPQLPDDALLKLETSDEVERLPSDALLLPVTPNPGEGDEMEALVAEAVGELHSEIRAPSAFEASASISGLDHSRHAEAVSARAQYFWQEYGIMYEEYNGRTPFWVKDHNNKKVGPCNYEDTLKVIQHSAARGQRDEIAVSADGDHWVSSTQFVKLTGQELILDVPRATPEEASGAPAMGYRVSPRFSGTLAKMPLPAVFAYIHRSQLTGRLHFFNSDTKDERIDIHLVNGLPTFVYTSEFEMQLPQLMVAKHLLTQELLPLYVRMAILEERPLEEIVGREAGLNITPYRGVFMRERMLKLVSWNNRGNFHYDAEALPASMSPFATSLMAVLPDLIYRSMSIQMLRDAVWKHGNRPLVRSERFAAGVAAMGLTQAQRAIAARFGKGRTLSTSLDCEPPEEKLYLAMAYILLESEMLIITERR